MYQPGHNPGYRFLLSLISFVLYTAVIHNVAPTAPQAITDTPCNQSVSGECEAIFGPEVICGASGSCACASDNFVAVEDQCIRECELESKPLHDTSRRMTSYQRVLGEPFVTDRHIIEGWYSLGQHYLAGAAVIENLQPGACGTKYRIGLKDGSTVDSNSLDLTEVVATATVYGRPEGHSEDLEIKVRKCENDIQYYLRPTQIRLAAYCFDSANVTSTEDAPSTNFGYGYVNVQASLSFREEYRDNILFDVPFVVWSCDAQSYINQVSGFPDAQFITVSWFATHDLIKRSEPTLISQMTPVYLTEFDLLDAGYSLGVVIRCGVQASTSGTGILNLMTLTPFDTSLFNNLQSTIGEETQAFLVNNDHNHLQIVNIVPIGCAAPVGTTRENCTVKFHAVMEDGSSACSNSIDQGDEHELCGLTLFGLTKYGFERNNNYNSWDFVQDNYFNDNGTYVSENIGALVILYSASGETDSDAALHFSMTLDTNDSGHDLWDDYEIHNVQIYLSNETDLSTGQHSCYIRPEYITQLRRMGLVAGRDGYDYTMSTEGPGNYIMMWSRRFPFSTEIEVDYNTDGELYVCGVYIRYGNDIYAYGVCGGDFFEGLIYGDGKYIPEIITSPNNTFKNLGITMVTSWDGIQISNIFKSNSDFVDDFEGFCSFEVDRMIGRDGNNHVNPADFLKSWRIEYQESLTNPENHIQYEIESKYYTCGCPSKSDDIPVRDILSETQWYNTGAFRCNLDDVCFDATAGAEWPRSLRPAYLIEKVEVVVQQRLDDYEEPILWFTCLFRTVETKLHTVVWYIDDEEFTNKQIQAVQPSVDAFTLNDQEIYQFNGESFAFDMKIKCSASLLDNDLTVLVSPVMSEDFQLIQFSSNNIVITRGASEAITWTSNIPFLCTDGQPQCHMEIQFYDPNDSYDCEDSTIAIKGKDGNGGKITATSTVPAAKSTDTTTFTTKNNYKYELKDTFELRAVVIFHGAGRSNWKRVLRNAFHIAVVDEGFWIRQSSHLHPDPHARNFDGTNYEMQHVGLFVLLRHTSLPVEIQTITMPCGTGGWGDWSPTCSCAVIIRAGADIYVINHCNNSHVTGFLSAGDGIIEVYNRDDTRYQVFLPTLMMVDIFVMPYFDYFMTVDIYPSPVDKNNLVGLCGNFNGDRHDDFNIRDTTNAGTIDEFSLSWELTETGNWETESLLEEANYQNPSAWPVEEKLCVFPFASTGPFESVPICSVNEEKTCTKEKTHKGKKLNTETRPKRNTGRNANLDMKKRVDRLTTFIFEQHEIRRKKREVQTVSNMTEAEALVLCKNAFATDCPINDIDGKPISEEQYLNDCAKDVAATGDIAWAKGHCIALTTRIENEVAKDVAYARNNTQVVADMERLCTGNCNGHGTCVNGSCQCDEGWGRNGCILDRSASVEISYITGGGLCNRQEDDCLDFIIETNGLDEYFKSRIVIFEVSADGRFHQTDEFECNAEAFSYNEAVVDVECGRRRRDTSNDTVLAYQYGVSVSNDGVSFGNIMYVTVLDTKCQETTNNSDGDTIVILMAGFCYIEGVCYSEGNTSADNSCQLCRTAINLFDWTEENCSTSSAATDVEHNGLSPYVIIFPICGGLLVIVVISGIVFLRYILKKRPISPEPPPPYSESTSVGPSNLRFYLRDLEEAPFKPEKGETKGF